MLKRGSEPPSTNQSALTPSDPSIRIAHPRAHPAALAWPHMPADVAVPAPCANYSLRGTCAGVLWVGLMGVSFMGIFTAWICTQSFAVKL
eukprot:SAG31_NODE_1487_length_8148_cov_4.926823_8_plen_90_part_00